MTQVQLIFRTKHETLKVAIPETLFVAVRKKANRVGMPYKRYILRTIERAVTMPKRSKANAG
jgi:predicted DNA binding CopG/RHH family protein